MGVGCWVLGVGCWVSMCDTPARRQAGRQATISMCDAWVRVTRYGLAGTGYQVRVSRYGLAGTGYLGRYLGRRVRVSRYGYGLAGTG